MGGTPFPEFYATGMSAVGNGVADDTYAINNALQSIPAGETLHFPLGTYNTTTGLQLVPGKSVNFAPGATITASTAGHGAVEITQPGAYQVLGRGVFTGASGQAGVKIYSGAKSGTLYMEPIGASISNSGGVYVSQPLPASGQRKRIPVLTRCTCSATASGVGMIGKVSNGTDTLGTFRTNHYVTANCSNLTFIVGNADAETPGANVVTYKHALEDSTGNVYPIFFGGLRSVTLEPGAFKESDPLAVSLTKGDMVWLRNCPAVSSGTWINRLLAATSGEGYNAGNDSVDSGGTYTGLGSAFMYAPQLVFGDVSADTENVAIVGDSIAAGLNSARQGDGYIVLGLGPNFGQNFPYANAGLGGDYVKYIIQNLYRFQRSRFITDATSSICDYGINDLQFDGVVSVVQSNLVIFWKLLKSQFGIQKLFQTTWLPSFNSSTDGWVTVANQTAATNNPGRIIANTWFRAGAPLDPVALTPVAPGTAGALTSGNPGHPLDGVFEAADLAESSRNSGLWNAGYTNDGLHPNGTGCTAISACIDTTKL